MGTRNDACSASPQGPGGAVQLCACRSSSATWLGLWAWQAERRSKQVSLVPGMLGRGRISSVPQCGNGNQGTHVSPATSQRTRARARASWLWQRRKGMMMLDGCGGLVAPQRLPCCTPCKWVCTLNSCAVPCWAVSFATGECMSVYVRALMLPCEVV